MTGTRRVPAYIVRTGLQAAVVAQLALGSPACGTAGNVGQGHLSVRSLSPGHLLRPGVSSSVIPATLTHDLTLGVSTDWGNVWNYRDPQFIYDAEQMYIAAHVIYRLTPRSCINATFPYSGRVGGWSDRSIERFHKALGMTNANREARPRNEVLIRIRPGNGEEIHFEGNEWGRSDIPLFFSYQITAGGDLLPALAVQVGMTLPTGEEKTLEGAGEPVYGTALLASKRMGETDLLLLAGLSFSYSRQDELAGVRLRREELTALAGCEYQWSQRTSVVAQYVIGTPVAESFYEFSDPIHELNIGFKRRLRDRVLLEWAFAENLFTFDNSTDVAMHLGMKVGF